MCRAKWRPTATLELDVIQWIYFVSSLFLPLDANVGAHGKSIVFEYPGPKLGTPLIPKFVLIGGVGLDPTTIKADKVLYNMEVKSCL